MGDISKRFSRKEFACPCGCGFDTVDVVLVNNLESLADDFLSKKQDSTDPALNATKVIVHINSGNRCRPYDRTVKMRIAKKKGIPYVHKRSKSQHLRSAVDFWMEYLYPGGKKVKIPDDDIADELEIVYVARNGIGRYNGRTHYDIRLGGPARWDKR